MSATEGPGMPNSPPGTESSGLHAKAAAVLSTNKLALTKDWLQRVIGEMEDLESLERFPTQESIRAAVTILDGLTTALRDESTLADFRYGGHLYNRAAIFGHLRGSEPEDLRALSNHLFALETAMWELLREALRHEDKELLNLVETLRFGLHGITTASMESYYLRASEELDRLAHTDALTGLYNRRYVIQQLERQLEVFKRYRHPFSLVMLDLDNLKWVNDTLGHPAGDEALKYLARLMESNVRDVDIAARVGGDEFIVLMPETGPEAVDRIGDRIRQSLAKSKLKLGDSLVGMEVSVGQASCPEDGQTVEELLQVVDTNLYRAKQRKSGTEDVGS